MVSDVDGTVTKSDCLGHAYNLINKDWFHENIAELHHKIQKNGYKMIYLSARACV